MPRGSMPSGERSVALASLLSLAGLWFHNWWDLPELSFLSPEYSGPTLVLLAILGLRWWRPGSRPTAVLLLLWGLVHLIGGAVVTVIPFDFLPFVPEQSLRHYAGHVVYGLTQLPLIARMVVELAATYRDPTP